MSGSIKILYADVLDPLHRLSADASDPSQLCLFGWRSDKTSVVYNTVDGLHRRLHLTQWYSTIPLGPFVQIMLLQSQSEAAIYGWRKTEQRSTETGGRRVAEARTANDGHNTIEKYVQEEN